MAKLTDPMARERAIPRQVGGTAQLRPVGPSDAVGRGLQQVGADLTGATDEVYRTQLQISREQKAEAERIAREQKIEQDKVDTLRAEEAFTSLREKQLDLTVGQENGFAHQRGAAAVNRPLLPEWTKRFEDASKEVAGSLANDTQRQRFGQRAAVAKLQFQEDLLRHLAKEGDTYAKEVYDGTLATEQRNAVARWDSPNDVALSLDRVARAVEDRADRNSWAPELREGVLREEQGKIHRAVVQQALAAGNYQYAQTWAKAHEGDVDAGTAAQITRAVEDGTQRQISASYRGEFLAAQDNPKALRELQTRVTADQTLDEMRRNSLIGPIQSRIQVLDHKAELANERRLRTIERGINQLNASTLAGFEPSAAQFAPYIAAAKGTELEGELRSAMNLANATRQFRTQPPVIQERMLTEAEAAARANPDKFDLRVLGAWRQIHETQRTMLREDPSTFAQRQGLVEPLKPLDLRTPESAAQGLAQRFSLGRALARQYGAPFKPFSREDTALLQTELSTGNVDQKRNLLRLLSQAAGTDTSGYMAVMGQIAPDQPVTAIAGARAAGGATAAADLLLRGEAILRPGMKADGKPDGSGLLPMPPEQDLRGRFDGLVRDAFAGKPEQRNAHYQAAKAVYAALSVDAGDRDTKIMNADRWETAIETAIGKITNFKGRRIVLPERMDEGGFKDGLRERINALVASGRLDPSWTASRLRDLPLENAGDGLYTFRSGDGVLLGRPANAAAGSTAKPEPVVIDFNVNVPSVGAIDYGAEPSAAELEAAAKPYLGAPGQRRQLGN